MNVLAKYAIPYKGLKIGHYRFEFTVDDRFFEAFEESEIRRGKAVICVETEREANRLMLDFEIEGSVEVSCDRCLEKFDQPIRYQGTLEVRFAENGPECDGEVMWVDPSEEAVNVAQYIYESICLSLPYQRVHPVGADGRSGCDPDMLARFSIVSEEEFARLASAEQPHATQKPWSGLEQLKRKMADETSKNDDPQTDM